MEIRMATKNSKATASYLVKEDIDIGNGKRISGNFLLSPISLYDVILRMLFITKANIILRPGHGNITFGDCDMTIKYALHGKFTAAVPITIIPELPELPEVETNRLEFLDAIRRTAKAAIDSLNDIEWEEALAHPYAEEMLGVATQTFNRQLPNFQQQFPTVFPKESPTKLVPLWQGLNYKITLKDAEISDYQNEYRLIQEIKLTQLSKWLDKWKKNGITVQGSAPYAAPIFGVPKKAPEEIWWVIDLNERNNYTVRDYIPIPYQPIISDHVVSQPFRSKIDKSNAYYHIRVEPDDEIINAIIAG